MGNIQSNSKQYISDQRISQQGTSEHENNYDKNYDKNNYNIDAQVIGKNDIMHFIDENLIKSNSKSNKIYIIHQQINGISKAFILNAKILDDNIFIYVTDIFNKKTVLVHVSKICTRSDKNTAYYLKYIQISRNFDLLSFPENDIVNVYDLTKLLHHNILEYVGTTGIKIIIKNNSKIHTRNETGIETGIETRVETGVETGIETWIETMTCTKNDSMTEFQDTHPGDDCESMGSGPYKCILYKDLYIIIHVEFNRYTKIIAIEYKKNIT